jgi:hypothetical protein
MNFSPSEIKFNLSNLPASGKTVSLCVRVSENHGLRVPKKAFQCLELSVIDDTVTIPVELALHGTKAFKFVALKPSQCI